MTAFHRPLAAAIVEQGIPLTADMAAGACKSCGDTPDSWCPDCAACEAGCYGGHVGNPCTHANASWTGGAS